MYTSFSTLTLQVCCIASPRKPSGSTPTCQRTVALPCVFSSPSDWYPRPSGRGLTTMWHEARKHERKLRGMMVDYKKRAERRREYYEKIVSDHIPAWVGGLLYLVQPCVKLALKLEDPVAPDIRLYPWKTKQNTPTNSMIWPLWPLLSFLSVFPGLSISATKDGHWFMTSSFV